MLPPGDAGALAKGIEDALRERVDTAAMVARGLERAEHFSMDNLAAHYLAMYERLLGS